VFPCGYYKRRAHRGWHLAARSSVAGMHGVKGDPQQYPCAPLARSTWISASL